MTVSRHDAADFTYFLEIARHRSFSRAAVALGISTSALSHSLKGLEARLGVRLLNRTNRSVTLTAAGDTLVATIEAPFAAIGQAVEALNRFRDTPAGRIRLNVVADAAPLLLAPVLPAFIARYPGIEIDITASNRMIDVVGAGYDAGIRYGGTVPADMIAQRLSADLRWIVVGAPAYLDARGTPQTPDDLATHQCLQLRLGDDRVYRWEFQRDGREFARAVPGTITLDDSRIGLELVRRGAGLMYAAEPLLRPLIDAGEVRIVLEDWATGGDGYQVYYSSRRQLPAGLRALIELIREMRPLGL